MSEIPEPAFLIDISHILGKIGTYRKIVRTFLDSCLAVADIACKYSDFSR